MYPYRVFVSYCRKDLDLVNPLLAALEKKLKVKPLVDQRLRGGDRFTEKIRNLISHAHVFLPVLTKVSAKRPWVHEEIGCAMAMGIPVVPVTVGAVPEVMLHDLQAVMIDRDISTSSLDDLRSAIKGRTRGFSEFSPNLTLARYPEARTRYLCDLTREAIREKSFGPLRQRAAFSSFCLPREGPSHQIWRERDGDVVRSEYMYLLLGMERRALEAYVANHGARLIIKPSLTLKRYGNEARRVRLDELLKFLSSKASKNVQVVVRDADEKHDEKVNSTIVGDWFSAVSRTPSFGYEETLFTWHAPTVLQETKEFDEEFDTLFKEAGRSRKESRKFAAEVVQKERDAIPNDVP